MFLSKIWFVLVGLAAGVATTAAFVAPRAADRRIVELEGERLDRAQYAAEQMLKADAHSWIDYAAKLSRDAILAESLDAASKGAGEARLVQRDRARPAEGPGARPGGHRPASGGRGRRQGAGGRPGWASGSSEQGESLAGIEVISDALRGYLSDDVWGAAGKLQRVAAVPVLSRARDRIVGALWVGAETRQAAGRGLEAEPGGRHRHPAARAGAPPRPCPSRTSATLPARIEERKQEIARVQAHPPHPVHRRRPTACWRWRPPSSGQAGEQGGCSPSSARCRPPRTRWRCCRTTTADDLRWGNFPWLGLALALIVILGVGLTLQRLETERPLQPPARRRCSGWRAASCRSWTTPSTRASSGASPATSTPPWSGSPSRRAPRSETARKDVGAILGPAPTAAPSNVACRACSTCRSRTSTSPAPGSAPPPLGGDVPPRGPPPPVFLALPRAAWRSAVRPPALGASRRPERRRPQPSRPGATAGPPPCGGGPASAPRPSGGYVAAAAAAAARPCRPLHRRERRRASLAPPFAAPSAPALPPPRQHLCRRLAPPSGGQRATGIVANPFWPPAPTVRRAGHGRRAGRRDARQRPHRRGGPAALADDDGARTTPPRRRPTAAARTLLDDRAYAAHIREVFEAYVATRRRCGETVATLTLDKFQARLETNRQQLVAKYGCRTRALLGLRQGRQGRGQGHTAPLGGGGAASPP